MSPLLCYLCYCDQETVSHLFVHRRKVWILRSRQWSFYAHGERQRRIWSLILMLCLGLFGWLGISASSMILCWIQIAFML
ncbi:hypothetical protein NC651_024174 [Populus alba x Populus x berolinensis]|nr:hypothetical protein NC651_024174 [Populus alba x Populus x berolinensis]